MDLDSKSNRVDRAPVSLSILKAMEPIRYSWIEGKSHHVFDLAFVRGTRGQPYSFGEKTDGRQIEVQDFYIGTVPVTQALWGHVLDMDANPAAHKGTDLPIENVSWDEITKAGGFLDRINDSPVRDALLEKLAPITGTYRTPRG